MGYVLVERNKPTCSVYLDGLQDAWTLDLDRLRDLLQAQPPARMDRLVRFAPTTSPVKAETPFYTASSRA
jgi:hypothetical protein